MTSMLMGLVLATEMAVAQPLPGNVPPPFVLPPGAAVPPPFVLDAPPAPLPGYSGYAPAPVIPVPPPSLARKPAPIVHPAPDCCSPPTIIHPVGCEVLSVKEFFTCFDATPGKHIATVQHPTSKKPVQICFVLPNACLKEVDVNRRSVEFEYKDGKEVTVLFRLLHSKWDVKYND
ncbi:hypothetical protein [Tuwongella immobilis]|uniref:Uncharacterized protein n=1 Tax=Tuwongella immobilis TaxID=692036 RepID=A0A6C2YKC5_9BACT|nr:hypothetical protein [Tuwongella immobilis]VIP01751.1 unnamed protein product [Tuwongella immobilis]VTR99340.1 unnamed protein product [Tuwongella immobilis]